MAFSLHPDAIAAGYGLVAHDTIGSTSVDAMARLRDGEAAPFWVVSSHQSAGRGRRGAGWATPPGNLAASLALRLDAEPATIATLGFVAGVALIRALETVARRPSPVGGGSTAEPAGRGAGPGRAVILPVAHPTPDLRSDPPPAGEGGGRRSIFALKWPNDVLADGAKLAGILLETETIGPSRTVVIGIGVNVAHAPQGLAYPTASLAGSGIAGDAAALFGALSAEWVRVVREWDDGRGFPAIRDAWLARAAGIGGDVAVTSGATAVRGRFETIGPTGQLVLRLDDGDVRAISAGDVHFGNAASLRAEAFA